MGSRLGCRRCSITSCRFQRPLHWLAAFSSGRLIRAAGSSTAGRGARPVTCHVDMKTKAIEEFVDNDLPGPAYLNQQNGLNRPSDVVFAPDQNLYIVDWGASSLDEKGP